jgi:hypothetical protein
MKTHRGSRRNYNHPRIRFRADNQSSGKSNNDFVNAALLFVLIGFFVLVLPVLTTRHHTGQLVLLWQPTGGTQAEDPSSRTVSPIATEGVVPILVGCILVGFGSRLKI